MQFTSGCFCAISISESEHYLSLQLFGDHNPGCHSRPNMTGRKSDPALGGFNSDNDSDDSVKRLKRVLGCSNNFHHLRNMRGYIYSGDIDAGAGRAERQVCATLLLL